MTNKLDLYKCSICGNVVQVMIKGAGELVCCGENMHHLNPQKIEQEMGEKHVPVFVLNECGNCEIRVGSVPHPMTEEHHIVFIQAISEDKNKVCTEFLYPNDVPKMLVKDPDNVSYALEYCNIHGLWEGTKND